MAYIFNQDELPRMLSVVPGREHVFFVSKELADMDDMLAGVMYYKSGASSPYHLHKNCSTSTSSSRARPRSRPRAARAT